MPPPTPSSPASVPDSNPVAAIASASPANHTESVICSIDAGTFLQHRPDSGIDQFAVQAGTSTPGAIAMATGACHTRRLPPRHPGVPLPLITDPCFWLLAIPAVLLTGISKGG